jgi:hypothetical protein
VKEEDIKNIESEKISNLPLGLITAYLNNLGYVLNFTIIDFLVKNEKQPQTYTSTITELLSFDHAQDKHQGHL